MPLYLYIGGFEQAASEELADIAYANGYTDPFETLTRRAQSIKKRDRRGDSETTQQPRSLAEAEGGAVTQRALKVPRPFFASIIDVLRLTAPLASDALPSSLPFDGARGVIKHAFVNGWMDGKFNNSIALWPEVTQGAVEQLSGYARDVSGLWRSFSSACDGPSFIAAFNDNSDDMQYAGAQCKLKIQALSQQFFSPPSPYEAFNVLCKGICRVYTAHWFRIQMAAVGTGCDCARDIEKGSFFCPVSAPSMLCRFTGLCLNESYYERSTCAPEACGRFATNERDWREARRSCA
jgi:hypothetical protein